MNTTTQNKENNAPLAQFPGDLRDRFAGQALIGLLIEDAFTAVDQKSRPFDDTARDAYRYADAMLDARKEGE